VPDLSIEDIKDNVYRHIFRVSRQVSQAGTDLVDALIAAFDALSRYQDQVEYEAWLRTVGRRVRGRFGHVEALRDLFVLAKEEEGDAEFDMMACIQRSLDSLPHHLHASYAAKELEGLSWDEAAKAVGTTVAALKSRLPIAREKIRQNMDAGLVASLRK